MTDQAKNSKKDRYLVIARKYRPQNFDDIIGQEHIVRTLKNAITQNRIHHFYLFSGSRGIGKTSTARVLAKAINCVEGPTALPCGKCHVCKQIEEGKGGEILALYEIDGASNRGVDDIRELRKTIRQKVGVRYRVIIIDEVHMLTPEAFNALLKTLEEPPEHVKFIFATTEAHKVPETIISRCQRLDFRRISVNEIAMHLREICEKENIDAEDDALRLIARIAEGGMRDSQSKLDQAIAFSEGQLSASAIEKIFGIISRANLLDLISSFKQKNFEKALQFAQRVHSEGIDSAQIIRDLIDLYRELLIIKTTSSESSILDISSDDREQLSRIAEDHTLDSIMFATEILTEALKRLKLTEFPRLTIEIAFIKLCKTSELMPLERLVSFIEAGAIKPGQKIAVNKEQPSSVTQKQNVTPKQSETIEQQAMKRNEETKAVEVPETKVDVKPEPKSSPKLESKPELPEKKPEPKKKSKSLSSSNSAKTQDLRKKAVKQFLKLVSDYEKENPNSSDIKLLYAWLEQFIISIEKSDNLCILTIGDDSFINNLNSDEGLNMLTDVTLKMFKQECDFKIEINKEAKIREKLRNNEIVRNLIKKFSASIISIKERKLWENEILEEVVDSEE